jgi:hypothetical protein
MLNLINIGFNPWTEFWKRNQTITYLFSQKKIINKVLFLHSEVWMGDLLKNPGDEFARPKLNKWQTIFPKKMAPKITAFTPVHIIFEDRFCVVKKMSSFIDFKVIQQFTKYPFVLILNDPQANQEIVDFLLKQARLTIFDWSDDFVEFSNNQEERKICANTCKKYCESSDIVFTINTKLKKKALAFNDNVHEVRNATNFFTFQESVNSEGLFPDIKKSGKQIVGYIGWLNSLRLDLDILEYLIMNRPDIEFVFMGPKSEEYPLGLKIPFLSNVHLLDPVPYSKYPSCLSALDVCILPNKISPHTDGNDPIKIYDYLASGNPVVSTKTAGTEQFCDYIYWANNKFEFLNYLDRALVEKNNRSRVIRRDVARQHSWQTRFDEINTIVEPFLQEI